MKILVYCIPIILSASALNAYQTLEYLVKEPHTFQSLSFELYGKAEFWTDLYELNSANIQLTNGKISPGSKILYHQPPISIYEVPVQNACASDLMSKCRGLGVGPELMDCLNRLKNVLSINCLNVVSPCFKDEKVLCQNANDKNKCLNENITRVSNHCYFEVKRNIRKHSFLKK